MDYTIKNAQRRSEWSMNGTPMQDYAITLEGHENKGWIKLTQKPDTRPPQPGDKLTGEIQKKFTKNGTEYWKFKKVVPDGRGGGSSGGGMKQEGIDYIILMLEELTLRRPAPDNPQPRAAQNQAPQEEYDDPFRGML